MKKGLTKAQLEKKATDLEGQWKRAVADYLNLEKRIEKEKSAFIKLANASLLDKLLPILDELETCTLHLKDEGLNLILSNFKKVLESEGVKPIKVKGKTFDPETMDAVEVVKGPKNKVIEVNLKGYQYEDKVLRPAKVKVGQG